MQPDPVPVMDFRGTYKGGGGPDKTVLNSAALHDPEKVDVLVTYIKQPDDNEFQIPQMAAERNLNYVDLVDRGMFDLKCLFGLRRLIKNHHIQVLHTHDDKTLLYGAALRLLLPKLRIMHTCHSHAVYGREVFSSSKALHKFQLRKKFLLWLMKRHHKPVLTVSENTRQRLVAGGLVAENVEVLHNGIDIRKWSKQDT
ncbi:glycosyltransferase, partial [bacterium]|nr:glycosyltransferase [bacterium]